MDASYDGTEVTVVMEEIEESYCYTSPGPPKKKKKYKIHGEKAKKPRLVNMFWSLAFMNRSCLESYTEEDFKAASMVTESARPVEVFGWALGSWEREMGRGRGRLMPAAAIPG